MVKVDAGFQIGGLFTLSKAIVFDVSNFITLDKVRLYFV